MRILALLIPVILTACSTNKQSTKKPSFYYWKTVFEFTAEDSAFLAEVQPEKLYVRFFDLESNYNYHTNYKIVPNARLINKTRFPDGIEIIPVVFIEEYSITDLSEEELKKHAKLTREKIGRMHKRYSSVPLKEIQVDCDWDSNSKDEFFAFTKYLRAENDSILLSSTIRLYQYKYFDKAGVPPVDKGVLMYYNMGDRHEFDEKNYVLNHEEGMKYMSKKNTYPLPIDLALPIYYQGIIFNQQDSSSRGLLNSSQVDKLLSENSVTSLGENLYSIKIHNEYSYEAENFFGYNYFDPGDFLRIDKVTTDDLYEVVTDLAPYFKNVNLIFFDWNPSHYKKYEYDLFQELQDLID
jgi:hypothetical protein